MTWLYAILCTKLQFAVLIAFVCSVLLRIAIADNGKVCGTTDIRRIKDFAKLENCRVIEGNLTIVLIDDEWWGDSQPSFPDLVEITDVLLFFRVQGLRSLGQLFPNLAVIGGQSLFTRYAFVVYELFDLEEIGLSNLTVIRNGAVRFEKNRRLCYIDTIDWARITKGVSANENYFRYNRPSIECANVCPTQCDETERTQRCWNANNCQKMLSCPDDCMHGYCQNGVCCHPHCVGGCTGPSPKQCTSCEAAVYSDQSGEDTCIQICPVGLYLYHNRRCITADQCIHFGDYKPNQKKCDGNDCMKLVTISPEVSVCSAGCPTGYQPVPEDKTRCSPCKNGKCPKVCYGKIIDSLNAAGDLKDCTIIDGSLVFRIKNCVDEEKLKEYLSNIEEVSGFIEISSSYGLHSLHMLKGLRKIGGQTLIRDKFSFFVFNNPNLQELLPEESLNELRLDSGSVLFQHNGKLSFDKILEFLSKTGAKDNTVDEPDIFKQTNGDKISQVKQSINLKVFKAGAYFAFINWQAVPLEDSQNLIGYSAYWKEMPKNSVTVFAEADICTDIGWKSKEFDCIYHNCRQIMVDYIAGLKPWTRYALYVRAITMSSEDTFSNTVYFTTAAEYPTEPLNLEVQAKTPGTLLLTWDPPAQPNGDISHYIITWKQIPIRAEEYRLRNYCTSDFLEGKIKTPAGMRTQTDCCPCSTDLDEISLSFQDLLQNYVYIKRKKQQDVSTNERKVRVAPVIDVTATNAEEYTLANLGHFEIYNFQVEACHGNYSHRATVCSGSAVASGRTLPDALSDSVHNVRIEKKEGSLLLKWEEPTNPNGIILTYDIEYMTLGSDKPGKLCIQYHAGEQEYSISFLGPDNYKFRVRGTSLAGPGPWSPWQTVYECHRWISVAKLDNYEEEKASCENDHGHVFTAGNNEDYPGCDQCRCCKVKGS